MINFPQCEEETPARQEVEETAKPEEPLDTTRDEPKETPALSTTVPSSKLPKTTAKPSSAPTNLAETTQIILSLLLKLFCT